MRLVVNAIRVYLKVFSQQASKLPIIAEVNEKIPIGLLRRSTWLFNHAKENYWDKLMFI